ncbi:histidine kinase [Mycobacterium sp. 852002-51163_SCH5372311]|uniref:serine/threonine-protein kinase n=1 Tax=Mycobacterium sp. 852002-51163_SCH5372311 TaxID=1834097 RepID=UPI0008006616|nr:serine/threonine-protein kinase [Mycobacterium sp. 852002-51163_SCH5372311]OBF85273.1 histidine kinase [Mycobacterium sp. 852002-51163_SCH5372311]
MPLAVGTVVAGYRIEGVLGSGGMGTVYLARHPTLPRSDALKILSTELSLDQKFRARFIREADLAATLNHPNIVTVFDRGETADAQLWIAMEYVKGTAANDISSVNLTPARITRITTGVARALDYAHSRRVLHRDVKPGNFLVSGPMDIPAADQERVLLADFGIARALDDASSLTATGSLVFTAAYAAPEAIEGETVDHRADIYSLGCSLFRLLTGRTPYGETGSLPAMLMAHMMRPVPRPSEVTPGLPPAIDAVIARAMAKNPGERFSTAGELAAATAAALTGHPAAPSSGSGSQTRSWTTRPVSHPTPPPALSSGPARQEPTQPPTPLGHQVAPAPHPPPATPSFVPESPGQRPRRRRRRALILTALALTVVAVATTVTVSLVGHHRGGGLAPYQPQTLTGVHGDVRLDQRPLAIAALGPGDPDAVLSLGVQPVVIGGMTGNLPSWIQPLVHSSPPVLGTPNPAAVAAAKPDLIIDTGDVDKATYDKLAAVAPTLTRPADSTQDWTWQAQLTWIAQALGRSDTAKTLIADAGSRLATIKSQHPGFGGKSITVVNFSGVATTAAARVSRPTSYLENLGFSYNTNFRRGPTEPPEVPLDTPTAFSQAQSTAVMVLCRTDPAAGGGGYNGLPTGFNAYTGILVIIDDPATIAAFNTGGPAANAYLNQALVNKLANQIH